jgi:hypothetical protein
MHTHTGGVNLRCPGLWEAAQRLLNNVQLCAEATPYRLRGYHGELGSDMAGRVEFLEWQLTVRWIGFLREGNAILCLIDPHPHSHFSQHLFLVFMMSYRNLATVDDHWHAICGYVGRY